MRLARSQRGFTLLELLIAVAIFAVVSALAYGGLSSVLRSSFQTQEANHSLGALQLAMSLIHQDLSQITNRSIRNEYGDVEPALKAPGDVDRLLSFTRRGWRNPAEQPRSTLQRVAYRLDDTTLIREYWRHLDAAANAEVVKLPLLEGVEEVKLKFLGTDGNWKEGWPALGAREGDPALPRALKITLKVKKWGSISRTFPILGAEK
ncbi:MAG TPA: type II secretion system protein GspJ [Gammaproteobacteria bacterium]|nr:type II secretion system protein GspJ [Gammaproteobacteria bacterium]